MKTWLKLTRTNAPLSCSGWYKFPDPYIVAEKKFNVKGVLYAKRIFFHRDAYIYIYLSFSFFSFVQRLLVSSPCLSVKSCWVWKYHYSNQRCSSNVRSTFLLERYWKIAIFFFFFRFEQRWFKIEERKEREKKRDREQGIYNENERHNFSRVIQTL